MSQHVMITGTRAAADTLLETVDAMFRQIPGQKDFTSQLDFGYDVARFRELVDHVEVKMAHRGAEDDPLPILVLGLVPYDGDSVNLLTRLALRNDVVIWVVWEADIPEHLTNRFEILDADRIHAQAAS